MAGRIGRLHLVTDAEIEPTAIVPMLAAAANAGADHVQVRYPRLPAGELFDLVTAVRRAISDRGTQVVVNDRVDVALAAGASGVHLGQRSLPVRAARRLVGKDMTLGVSVHSTEEAIDAVEDGADYLTFGHVFPTSSHPGEPGRALDALETVVKAVEPLPVIAIGGIAVERVNDVLNTGAHGVAVIRAILAAGDISAATSEFVGAMTQ